MHVFAPAPILDVLSSEDSTRACYVALNGLAGDKGCYFVCLVCFVDGLPADATARNSSVPVLTKHNCFGALSAVRVLSMLMFYEF